MMDRQQRARRRRRCRTRTSPPWPPSSAPTAPTPPPTAAASPSASSRASSATPTPSDHRPAASRGWPRSRASQLYLQPVQDLQIDSRVSRTQYQYTLEDADPDELAELGARACSTSSGAPAAARRGQRSAERRDCSWPLTIDRDTRLAPGHPPADHRRHPLRRLRPAAGLHHLHPAEPVPRHPGGEARVPAAPRRARPASTSALQHRRPGAALGLRPHRAARSPRSRINHQGQFPAVTLSFNPAPGVSLGDAVDAIAGRRGQHRPARRASSADFQGAAQAFHDVAGQRAAADPGRADHRLHRARRALRELHPPDDDPLDPALGGSGRVPGAHAAATPTSASSRSSGSSSSSAS